MSASKLTHHFSSHPAAFGFLASLPSDNITLISDYQTGIGAVANATLDTVVFLTPELALLIQLLLSKVLMEPHYSFISA